MRRLLRIALALGVLAVAGAAVTLALFYLAVLRDLPEINSLQDYRPNLITRVLDVDGNEVASFAKERRVILPIEQVPKHVVDAFIAAEDGSFYEHKGLDYAGILRAAVTNILEGRKAQGASTITQQVAKTFLLSPERTYARKLKDMMLARRIEQTLSKNDILYLYLNQIYFGAGAYGIEAAAQTYFGKSARDLQVHEAALIAGLVPQPAEWNPHVDPETRAPEAIARPPPDGGAGLPRRRAAGLLGGAAAACSPRPTGRSATPRAPSSSRRCAAT